MDIKLEKLYTLLNSMLINDAPELSGNLKNHIHIVEVEPHKIVIKINAPYYDTNIWYKENKIVYTGPKKGKTGYAVDLNKSGAWGSNNKSKGWVNRTVKRACEAIANEYGAIVDNRLGDK